MATRIRPMGLLDFIPKLSPRFVPPIHLQAVAELFERSEHEPVRCVVSVPPRHWKSELVKHAIARRLRLRPSTRVIFASYSATFAEKKSREVRGLYQRAGGVLAADAQSRRDWRTGVDVGGVWATSTEGAVTGEGSNLTIVDDAVKGRAEAESPIIRDRVYDWFNNDLLSRSEPGASEFVIMARWHEDDLAGRLIKDGWPPINLPAIDDENRALLPGRFPLSKLLAIKEQLGEYGWSSLYQGRPVPRGGAVFRDTYFYETPPQHFRVSIGIDVAYTARTRADYSVAVVLAECEGRCFVIDVRRAQTEAPVFAEVLKGLRDTWPGATFFWFTSTTERGMADLLREQSGIPITSAIAKEDKFIRAQRVAAMWNAGKIFVPRSAPWLDAFVSEIVSFTGVSDRHDDQVDALAAAYEQIINSTNAKSHYADDLRLFQSMMPRGRWESDKSQDDGWDDDFEVGRPVAHPFITR